MTLAARLERIERTIEHWIDEWTSKRLPPPHESGEMPRVTASFGRLDDTTAQMHAQNLADRVEKLKAKYREAAARACYRTECPLRLPEGERCDLRDCPVHAGFGRGASA